MDEKRDLRHRARGVWLGVLVASGLIAVALATPVVADDGTTSHLWNDHIKLMRLSGTINTDSNPVHWTKLRGVPSGLADGVDDGVEAAGFGLNKASGIFSIDPTEVQRRVTGGCGPGRAIREIVQDGSIDCDPVSQGASTTDDDTGTICTYYCTEGTLTLSQGTWAVTAKLTVRQADPANEPLVVDCYLSSGGLTDEATFRGRAANATIPMQLIATLDARGDMKASVRCKDDNVGSAFGQDLSIMATRVGG